MLALKCGTCAQDISQFDNLNGIRCVLSAINLLTVVYEIGIAVC